MEPRARAARHKSHINFPTHNLEELLYAFGAPAILPPLAHTKSNSTTNPAVQLPPYIPDANNPPPQLPETLRVLDEIITDFLIETCHSAVTIANYSGRTKLKLQDFEWAIRKDSGTYGHTKGLVGKIKAQKKVRAEVNLGLGSGQGRGGGEGGEGMEIRFAVDELQALGDVVGEEGTGKGKGRGRGKRRKRKRGDDGVAGEGDGDTSLVIRGQVDGVGEDDEDDEDFGGGGRRIKREASDGGEMLIEDGLEEERMERNGR